MLNIDVNSSIKAIVQEYISGNQTKYDYEYILLENEAYFGIYEKNLFLLFNNDKQLLGYATFPKITAGETYVHFHKYVQSN